MAAILEQLIGQVLDEKYRVEEKLGQGGMGAVYLATHVGTERTVALKVIAPQFMSHPEFVERFKREAKAAGRLRHPNVVNVTDFGFAEVGADRLAYLVMEYLDGCNLGEVLNEESRLPLGFVVDIIEQVCAAVGEAHRQGIIHRDLKPDNIWLEPNGRGGYTVKVLDFGLAKLGEAPRPLLDGEVAIMLPNEPCLFEKFIAKTDPVKLPQPTGPLNGGSVAKSQGKDAAKASGKASESPRAAKLNSFESAGISAVTAVQPAANFQSSSGSNSFQEAATNIHISSGNYQETATLSPPTLSAPTMGAAGLDSDNDEEATKVQVRQVTARNLDAVTAKAGITHVGTVLGTPLYMSPEQCRGDRLDTRTDIYSIGVIAYQMLAGQTPFSGDTNTLIAKHTEIPPPALREQRRDIPKSIALLIMSALAKNPAERPATATAFGNALRARAEGAGSLLRQSISFYSRHFPTFIRISLIGHIPLIIFTELLIIKELWLGQYLPKPLATLSFVLFTFGALVADMFAKTVNAGAFTPAVAQLMVAPLRQVELRPLFYAVKSRFWALAFTCFIYQVLTHIGLAVLVIPGIVMTISYSLHTPIVMMEKLSGWQALVRSKFLVHQLKSTVVRILIVNWIACSITGLIGALSSMKFAGALQFSVHSPVFVVITQSIAAGAGILINPLIAIALAMLYFKTRQATGETVKETIGNFFEESYRSKWQQRISERIRMRTQLNGSTARPLTN